jgi:competence protein ComEC
MDAGILKVHFLNVGHGDCTVIKHPSGRITVIDTSNGEAIDDERVTAKLNATGGSRLMYDIYRAVGFSAKRALREAGAEIELTNPVEFLERTYPGETVFRYVQTHPEMDHMRGIEALLDRHRICAFWDTANTRDCEPRTYDVDDWKMYQSLRDDDRRRVYRRGDRHAFFGFDDIYGNGTGDNIQVLSPSATLTADCDSKGAWNDMSIVLKVSHNGWSFIFGGDAEEAAWESMLADESVADSLPCSILKAAHHGRKTGYHAAAVTKMAPVGVVMSIGEECEHEARALYRKHTDHILSTYDYGDITMTVDQNGTFDMYNGLAVR